MALQSHAVGVREQAAGNGTSGKRLTAKRRAAESLQQVSNSVSTRKPANVANRDSKLIGFLRLLSLWLTQAHVR